MLVDGPLPAGHQFSLNHPTPMQENPLKMALSTRRPKPGLIHHTDRGVQGGFKGWSQRRLN
jgi:hypothetical protein